MGFGRVVKNIWKIAVPVLLYLAVTVVVQCVALFFAVPFDEYATEITAAAAICSLPFLVLLYRQDNKKEEAETKDKSALRLPDYLCLTVLAALLVFGLNYLILFSGITEMSESYQKTATLLYTPPFWAQILCVGLIVPITEELIFRGLVYKRLCAVCPVILAAFLSALGFGAFHGNLVQGIYAFFCGLALCAVMEKYKTIQAPVFLHMAMNIISCGITAAGGF